MLKDSESRELKNSYETQPAARIAGPVTTTQVLKYAHAEFADAHVAYNFLQWKLSRCIEGISASISVSEITV